MKSFVSVRHQLQRGAALGAIAMTIASCGADMLPDSGNVDQILSNKTMAVGDKLLGTNKNAVHDSNANVKGNCTATHLWSKRFGDTSLNRASGTAIDSAGNIVLTGSLFGTADFGGGPLTSADEEDIFLAKFDTSGNHLWSKRFGDVNYQAGHAVVTDSSGNVVVHGYFGGLLDFGGMPLASAGLYDMFMVKFDPNGNHLWSRAFAHGTYYSTDLTIDTTGNVVLSGTFDGTLDFGGGPLTSAGNHDVFVTKFNPNGIHLWSKRFGDANVQTATSTVIDSAGNIVLTGVFNGTVDFGGGPLVSAGSGDIFVAKFAPDGSDLWSKRVGYANGPYASAAAVDNTDNVVLTGYFDGTANLGGTTLTSAGNSDVFMVKFDSDGNHLWSKRFGDGNRQEAIASAIDGTGNVVLTGFFFGTVDFGGGLLNSSGNNDVFVVKFDPDGNHIWSQHFGDGMFQAGIATAIDGTGNIIFAGNYQGTVDFGGGPLTCTGAWDLFVAKLVPCVPLAMGSDCATNGNCGSDFCDPEGNVCACDGNDDCAVGEICNTAPNPNMCTNCGNGVFDAAETCDDGNFADGDGCDSNCTQTTCGNGIATAGEICDDGNTLSGDGCNAFCASNETCGNAFVDIAEACDDGNVTNDDGCDINCTVSACGNGIIAGTEICDDSNTVDGDSCDSNCTTTACGNGVISGSEACDDDNLIDDDGCDSNCTATGCGNGIVTGIEVCDDGNTVDGDGCNASCTSNETCGNAFIDVSESCDDGDLIDGNDCDSNCTVTACGNGVVTTGEQCDDGNTVDDNGCTAACLLDTDNDTVPDDDDSCPGVTNEKQDTNMNGTDDACDCQAPGASKPDVPAPLDSECMEMSCIASTGKWTPFAVPDHTTCSLGYCLAGECINKSGSMSSDDGGVGTGGMTGSGGSNDSSDNVDSSAVTIDAFGPSAPNLRGGGGCSCLFTASQASRGRAWFVLALLLAIHARRQNRIKACSAIEATPAT